MEPSATRPSNPVPPIPAGLGMALLLGRLLQRLDERPGRVSAEQYRSVAQRLAQVLAGVPADAASQQALQALLVALPAMAEVYENLHYERAGLCRAPLVVAARAEVAARDVIARVAARV